MTAQEILNQLRAKVEADYKRGLELVKFMEETMPQIEKDLESQPVVNPSDILTRRKHRDANRVDVPIGNSGSLNRNPLVDAINGIPEAKVVTKLVEFQQLSMTDKIRKAIMGLGPNAELRRHDLVQALKANVTPWTTKLDGEVTTSLTWLLVQGELKKIGRGVMSVYRISDMKPVASSGELVGKISTKEEEWKKLRETITVPRDVLEDVGVDK